MNAKTVAQIAWQAQTNSAQLGLPNFQTATFVGSYALAFSAL